MKVISFSSEDFIVPENHAVFVRQENSRELIATDLRNRRSTRFNYPTTLAIELLCDSPGRYTLDDVIAVVREKNGIQLQRSVLLEQLSRSGLFTTASASFRYPRLSLILRFVYENLVCRRKLRRGGREVFVASADEAPVALGERRIGAVIPYDLACHLAAARLACSVPGVSRDSLITATALAAILKSDGYPAIVRTGRQAGHLRDYHWVEVDRFILDVGDSERDLQPRESR